MGWKDLSFWLRGLIIGFLAGIILVAFYSIEYLKCQENPIAYGDALRCLGPGLGFAISIWIGIALTILGLIIGWIVGKIKSRK